MKLPLLSGRQVLTALQRLGFWKSIAREATSKWSTRMDEGLSSVPCGGGSLHPERSFARRRG